ncbi:MAG TPA: TraR/DksA C4-type zinc finger protein [Candidatus Udaeobacter sp.]|nr:TraR/DksA C4-type zinc finger protein [Candidatus Udaeobacter sp.]
MTPEELTKLKTQLNAERDRLMTELGYMERRLLRNSPRDASGDLSGYSFHLADAGTDADEREKAAQLTSAEGRLLADIDAALERMEAGTYGVCAGCGGDIGFKRLAAMPSATRCIACKEKEERSARLVG